MRRRKRLLLPGIRLKKLPIKSTKCAHSGWRKGERANEGGVPEAT